jgi:preprotein translocase subunit SecG
MLFIILLTIQIIIGLVLVGLVLLQRSEGGALGMGGGGDSGFMSARGAGNFLTRTTSILAMLFFVNCIGLTIVSNFDRKGTSVVDKLGTETIKLDDTEAARAQTQAEPSLTELPKPAAPSLSTLGVPAAAPSPTATTNIPPSAATNPAVKPATTSPQAQSAPKPITAPAQAPASSAASQ